MIQCLQNQHIDKNKWDNIVANSIHSDIYAFSWYLDVVCPDWEALILNDYEAIFPLPTKRNFCFKYIVQPILSQRYSVYATRILSHAKKELFYKAILHHTSVRMCVSEQLTPRDICRTNYTLNLSLSYDEIKQTYAKNTWRNIQKAKNNDLQCKQLTNKNIALHTLLELDEKKLYIPYQTQLQTLIANNSFEAYEVSHSNESLAVAFFAKTKQKIYYLMPASSTKGKNYSAMFLLIDKVIQKYENSKLILDFEGSELDGLKRFYEGFGATSEPYYFINRKFLF